MIVFAAFLVAAVGMIALVTDVGASRDARARLVTSTDAAALAAAQDYAAGGNGCNADEDDSGVVDPGEQSIAEERLLANNTGATMDFCGITTGTRSELAHRHGVGPSGDQLPVRAALRRPVRHVLLDDLGALRSPEVGQWSSTAGPLL